jgi:hypothetical protein
MAAHEDSGAEKIIQMRYNLVDPVPSLKIDGEAVNLLEPLQWVSPNAFPTRLNVASDRANGRPGMA